MNLSLCYIDILSIHPYKYYGYIFTNNLCGDRQPTRYLVCKTHIAHHHSRCGDRVQTTQTSSSPSPSHHLQHHHRRINAARAFMWYRPILLYRMNPSSAPLPRLVPTDIWSARAWLGKTRDTLPKKTHCFLAPRGVVHTKAHTHSYMRRTGGVKPQSNPKSYVSLVVDWRVARHRRAMCRQEGRIVGRRNMTEKSRSRCRDATLYYIYILDMICIMRRTRKAAVPRVWC